MPDHSTPTTSTTESTTESTSGFATRFRATVLGYPRIGPHRELKKALEKFWAGQISIDDLTAVGRELRGADRAQLRSTGLDSIPVNTFSYYDHVLDTAVLLGALPDRFAALRRRTRPLLRDGARPATVAPLEMTKWFDTNYHYLVPEISTGTDLRAASDAGCWPISREARALGSRPGRCCSARSPSCCWPSRHGRRCAPLDLLDDSCRCTPTCSRRWLAAGAQWVQLDEPALVARPDAGRARRAPRRAYTALSARDRSPGDPGRDVLRQPRRRAGRRWPAPPFDARTSISCAGAGQLERRWPHRPRATRRWSLGVVDGRNVWRTDPDAALGTLAPLLGLRRRVAVGTRARCCTCRTTLDAETAPRSRGAPLAGLRAPRRSPRSPLWRRALTRRRATRSPANCARDSERSRPPGGSPVHDPGRATG